MNGCVACFVPEKVQSEGENLSDMLSDDKALTELKVAFEDTESVVRMGDSIFVKSDFLNNSQYAKETFTLDGNLVMRVPLNVIIATRLSAIHFQQDEKICEDCGKPMSEHESDPDDQECN